MDWMAILMAALLAALDKCQENQTKDRLRKRLRRNGVLVRGVCKAALRSSGCPATEIPVVMADIKELLTTASDDELDELIDDARPPKIG